MKTSQQLPREPSDSAEAWVKYKGILKLTGRSIPTLTKRLPEIVDGNPVKMALGLAKLIIEIQQVRRGSSYCSSPDYRPRLWQTIWILLNEG